MDFWIPKFKWQYVEWFEKHYPEWKISSWTVTKLKAVYIKTRLNNR